MNPAANPRLFALRRDIERCSGEQTRHADSLQVVLFRRFWLEVDHIDTKMTNPIGELPFDGVSDGIPEHGGAHIRQDGDSSLFLVLIHGEHECEDMLLTRVGVDQLDTRIHRDQVGRYLAGFHHVGPVEFMFQVADERCWGFVELLHDVQQFFQTAEVNCRDVDLSRFRLVTNGFILSIGGWRVGFAYSLLRSPLPLGSVRRNWNSQRWAQDSVCSF